MSFEKPDRSQSVFEIDLRHVILDLQKKWRRVLLFCVLSAFLGLAVSRFSYVPVYTSDTTFVVSNKTVGILNESDSMTISDFNASTALANTFKYILLSDEAMQAIIDAYGLDMSVGSLKSCVNVTPVSNTNILEMSVTTPDALLSYQVASRIIAHYPDVLERTIKNASLDVLNPPQIAAAADSYHGSLIYPLIGFFLALLIAVIIIYIIQVCSDTIKTVSDIGDKLGIGVLASIPKVKSAKKKKIARSGLNILDKSNGFAFAESYKALRTKIKMTAEKKGYKTFIVTSSLENEGKTTAAVNLSIALAGSGKKVLLIDADLRKPSVYLFAGKTDLSPAHELDTVLRGSMAFAPAVVAVEKFGISALLSTGPISDPSELLSSPKMNELLNRVSEKYDYVIIDTSPAGILTDAVALTPYADAVILSIRQDYAPSRLIESVVQSLSNGRAELIGCIFNYVDERGFDYRKYGYRSFGRYDRYEKKTSTAISGGEKESYRK